MSVRRDGSGRGHRRSASSAGDDENKRGSVAGAGGDFANMMAERAKAAEIKGKEFAKDTGPKPKRGMTEKDIQKTRVRRSLRRPDLCVVQPRSPLETLYCKLYSTSARYWGPQCAFNPPPVGMV